MTKNMLSVIMPVYNVVNYIEVAIKAVLQQSYQNIELILIDDGSTDGSSEICERLADSDSRIKLIKKKNTGVSAARNDGLDMAIGDYITFVDSDDWLEIDAYEKMIEYLQHSNADICVMGFTPEGNRKFAKPLAMAEKQVFSKDMAVDNLIDGKLYTWTIWDKIYKRELLENVRFLNNIYNGEDLLFNWQVFRQSRKIAYIPLHAYHYVQRTESMTNTFSAKKLTAIDAFYKIMSNCNDEKIYKKVKFKFILTLLWLTNDYALSDNCHLEVDTYHKLVNIKKIFRSNFCFIIGSKLNIKQKLIAGLIMVSFPMSIRIIRVYFRNWKRNIQL